MEDSTPAIPPVALGRSNSDKRKAVAALFDALEAANEIWTDNRMAKHLGVSGGLVGKVRAERAAVAAVAAGPVKRVASDGKLHGPKHQAPKAKPPETPAEKIARLESELAAANAVIAQLRSATTARTED